MLKQVVFDSGKAGPSLLVTSAVHGDEQEPPKAVEKIISKFENGHLDLLRGKVIFIPYVNKPAFDKNKRCVDEDLNRIFKYHADPDTSEKKIANEIIRVIDACDYYVDLHTMTADSPPTLFLDYETQENAALALAVGVPTLYIGWPEMYVNSGLDQPSSTDYAQKVGKHAILVECGSHKDPKSAIVAESVIERALGHLGMVHISVAPPQNIQAYRYEEIIRKEDGGVLHGAWNNHDVIKAGTEIVHYNNSRAPLVFDKDRIILMPNVEAKEGQELFYLGSKIDNYSPPVC